MNARADAEQPSVLLLASRYDLTCDYVVAGLRRRSVSYLRLNTEDLASLAMELDPVVRQLLIKQGHRNYCVNSESLQSVLFRRPVFLRDYGDDRRPPGERFSRLQWSAFVRNLMVFSEARWINDPAATYRAEHKAVQLAVAARVGFSVPETRVTNAPDPGLLGDECVRVAIKGLDTVLLRNDGEELFGFTTFENSRRLRPDSWRTAPATIQAALTNKLDVRVTVVEDRVYAASITANGGPVEGDWRQHKRNVGFQRYHLPTDIARRSRELVKALGLRFGGIDLALCNDVFYFLEINPTGEWAWLVDAAGLPIDEAIADALCREGMSDVG